jgi:sugar lactone lactonase YvrE
VRPPTVLTSGLAFGESPRWHEGRLWLADWGRQEIVAVESDGKREVMLRVPTSRPEARVTEGGAGQGPFSIDWLPDGRLLVLSGRDRALLRQEADGSLVPHADVSELGWNELVVDGRGNAYINSPGFDFVAGEPFVPGVVALVTPDGRSSVVAEGLAFPNGMAVTPDNSTLIVAESYGHRLTAYEIAEDGRLSSGRSWADLGDRAAPDGICIDADGAVWYADVPNECCVRVREGGDVVDRVELDRGGFACMLGGEDGTSLFVVTRRWTGAGNDDAEATGQVVVVEAPAPHAGWP